MSQQSIHTGIDHSVATAAGKLEVPAYKNKHFDTCSDINVSRTVKLPFKVNELHQPTFYRNYISFSPKANHLECMT